MRRTPLVVLGLEAYALVLAWLQSLGGVRTDEAKYLLNIPYPHPPLGRFIFHLTEAWPFQELFWRVALATLVVQAVWLVWMMAKTLPLRDRIAVCGVWICSAAVLTQAGSIMLAVLTGLQGLVLVALFIRRDIDATRYAGWLAVFWGCCLFTAFQAILYLPLVIALFARSRVPLWFRVFGIVGPIVLIALYVLGHPLAAASFILVRGDNAGLTVAARLAGIVAIWGIAGSVWGAVLGLAGMLMKRAWTLLLTAALLSAYIVLTYHDYYAILFLPLIVAGVTLALRQWPIPATVIIVPVILATILLYPPLKHRLTPDESRIIAPALTARHATGAVLLTGTFGHQWQYESDLTLRRFRPELLKNAQVVVCLQACPEMKKQKAWVTMADMPLEVWVKR